LAVQLQRVQHRHGLDGVLLHQRHRRHRHHASLPPAKVSGATNSATYGGYVFSCSATLPDFSLTLNGVKQRVPGRYINYSPVEAGSSTCFGGIQPNTGIGFSIFGDIFLKSKYVVFNGASTPKIGFADQPNL
jgi:hypothetical protein